MRNLTAPKQYTDDKNRTSFDAGSEGLVLYTPAGEPVRLHVGADGFLYINHQPFGVQGMPPALHAAMHATGGGDPVTPAAIGAVPASRLADSPKAAGVPVLDGNGHLPAEMIAGRVTPAVHAASHAKGGADAITPTSIGAVASNDTRLSDARTPTSHAVSHAVNGSDAITPESIGAVNANDFRLSDSRVPKTHRATHNKNGSDPISWFDVGSVDAEMFTVRERIPYGYPQLNDSGHIDINLLPTSTLLPGNHASSHAADGSDPVTPISINAADRQHSHGNADITGLDASKVTSGVLDLARIPQGALERLVIVSNQAAMLALTSADVQVGDTVQLDDTRIMYRVLDESALGTMDAFVEYSAGRAASVPWTGVADKPAAYTPTAHAAYHASGGSDPITPASIGAVSATQFTTHTAANGTTATYGHVKLDALAADGSNTAAPGGFGLGMACVLVSDLDSIKSGPTCFFRTDVNTLNTPVTDPGIGLHLKYGGASFKQLWFKLATGTIFYRGDGDASWTRLPGGITNSISTISSTIAASATAVKGLADRIANLESIVANTVTSTNISAIYGSTLEDGVGTIQFTEKS